MFRSLFPSFEKPDDRPRYINIEPERRNFRGVGIVLLLAVSCGVALALWEPSHQVTSPFVTASAPRSAPATVGANVGTSATVDSDDDDDQTTPTVKLSTLCSQRATARRDCANVKALKDARLTAPDPDPEPAPVPAPAREAKPATVAAEASSLESKPAAFTAKVSGPEPKPVAVPDAKPAVVAAKVLSPPKAAPASAAIQPVAAVASEESHPVPPADIPNAQQSKTTSASKTKRPRPGEEPPIERLVRVYDQVLPDGRRVPVYRRVGSGSLEIGTIVDGEYRPARRANLDPPTGRYYGLQ